MATQESTRVLSVVVAGATGAVGRELVSRLVSNPRVGRVVALVRRPISVDRWEDVFPSLRLCDAIRFLSVVAVDWDSLVRDVSLVPLNEKDLARLERRSRSDAAQVTVVDRWDHRLFRLQHQPRYKNVFSGHDVAVNCMGSRSLLSWKQTYQVDHRYGVAFAKIVRLMSATRIDTPYSEAGGTTKEEIEEVRAACHGDSSADALKWSDGDESYVRLKHFAQLSTAGASPVSLVPFFRAHGACDDAVTALMSQKLEGNHVVHTYPVSHSVWRPGLLQRPNQRRLERLLLRAFPAVGCEAFAQAIAEFVTEGAYSDPVRYDIGYAECMQKVNAVVQIPQSDLD